MNNPFLTLIAASFLTFLSINSVLSQRKEDVIYLSNGTIIHGLILKDTAAHSIRILNHAGDTWVFDLKEVDSVKHEKPHDYQAIMFNRPGFEYDIDAEFLIRSRNNAVGKATIPGINMIFGYRFNSYIMAGTEIGMEFYEWMEIPFSASVRVRTSNRAFSPFVFLRAGYTVPAEKRGDDWDYEYKSRGGLHTTLGIGIEKIINENASFVFSFSYHYQELNYHLTPRYQWTQERDRTETYSRFRLSVGYVLK